MAAMFMMGAGKPRILEVACKPFFRHGFHLTRTAAQDVNAVTVQHINRALPHIAGQHELNAFFRECLRNIRFAATSGGRGHLFLCYDFIPVVYSEYRKVVTVSEVFVNFIVSGR
jgi:hypothetical protein